MAKTKFKWQDLEYSPYYLEKHDEKDLRKEYSRLRSIARKRVERIRDSEFSDSQVVKHYGKLPPIAEIENKQQLVYNLAQVHRFLVDDISLRKMRKERKNVISKLHEHGFDFVNRNNFLQFADFMETLRTLAQGMIYDSDEVAQMFNDSIVEEKIKPEDLQKMFSDFVESQRNASNIKKVGGKGVINSADLAEWRTNLFNP